MITFTYNTKIYNAYPSKLERSFQQALGAYLQKSKMEDAGAGGFETVLHLEQGTRVGGAGALEEGEDAGSPIHRSLRITFRPARHSLSQNQYHTLAYYH